MCHLKLDHLFDELRKLKLENAILHKDMKKQKDEIVKLQNNFDDPNDPDNHKAKMEVDKLLE